MSRHKARSRHSEFNSQNLGNLLKQGMQRHQQGQLQAAAELYQRVLAYSPKQADALHLLGMTYYEQGDFRQAKTLIHQALQQSSQPLFLYNLSLVLTSMGELFEAQQRLTEATQLKPDYAQAWENLAQITWLRGDFIRSYQAFLQVLRLKPGNANAIYGLFSVLAQLDPNQYSVEREGEFIGYLQYPDANYQQLANAVMGLLNLKYQQQGAWSVDSLISDPLLLAALPKFCFGSALWEASLVDLRRVLLLNALQQLQIADADLPMVQALAHQAFINEYVWFEDQNEKNILSELEHLLATLAVLPDCQLADVAGIVLLLSLYRLPADLAQSQWLCQWPVSSWPEAMQSLIQLSLFDVLEEQNLARHIPSLSVIQDPVSLEVQGQYEQHPYPRWLSMGYCKPAPLAQSLRNQFPNWTAPDCLDGRPLRVLVAGCGTGQHVLQIAMQYQGAQILAIDLSRRSLAYAQRQAQKMQVSNIEFMQADILQLQQLNRQFDLIESVGVLHHMQDPLKGWHQLRLLLAEGGLMRIGLYSALARREIQVVRQLIAEQGLLGSADDIRQMRTKLLALASPPGFTSWLDFYSSSGCRDLLFHVQEYQFGLPEIQLCLDSLKLRLVGISGLMPAVMQQYRQLNPSDPYGQDLALWHQFELTHPDTFGRMYHFWCQS